MNGKKKFVSLLLAGALVALPVCAQAATGSITGTVTSAGNERGVVKLSLTDGVTTQTVNVIGNSGSYILEGVEQGEYTLRATKYNHVPREYEVTVTDGSLTQDVKLCLQGDVTGDGRINMGDTAKAYAQVRQPSTLADAYAKSCADMNQDGRLNMGDVAKINALVRNPGSTPEIPALPDNPVEDNKDEPVAIGGTLSFDAVVAGGL